MFLRSHIRRKDGKDHRYWTIAESVRNGHRVFQRQVLYLGELNDSQQKGWTHAINVLGEDGDERQMTLFPMDRTAPEGTMSPVHVNLAALTLSHQRQWGGCWLAMELWNRIGLDSFWRPLLPRSRKGINWLALLKVLVTYRLVDPGSEWKCHREWLEKSAMRDLLGDDVLVGKSTLYNALDGLCEHSDKLFAFLRNRWCDMFGSRCDVVLYDLTSTYFECDGTKVERSALQRHGYSRDKRGDCLQVVIALVLTPDGFPLAYEVMPGNTSDKETQMPFIRRLEGKYGRIGNLWLMDRGVPSEKTLKEMREGGYRYLVGAPRGHLKVLGDKLKKTDWQNVQDGVDVKVAKADDMEEKDADGKVTRIPGDTFVLTRSAARSLKETSMRVKRIRRAMDRLFKLDRRIGRAKWKKAEPSKRELTRDELIKSLAVAEEKAGGSWKMISVTIPKEGEKVTPETFTWKLDWGRIREARANDEGTYLLRTNLPECDPRTLWKRYMIQGEIEYAFRELKNDLGLRPVYHQLDDRIEAHIFTAFMALCLLQTLRAIAREHAPGLTPRQIIDKFRSVKMVDVVMPTTDGRIVTLPRYVEPKPDLAILLDRLGMALPAQPPPKISGEAVEAKETKV